MKRTLLFGFSLITSLIQAQTIEINEMGRYTDGRDAACEIAAYDKMSGKLFITNAASDSIDIVNAKDQTAPVKVGGIDVTLYGGGVNSVANLNNGFIAAAIEAPVKQDTGKVVFFDTNGVYVTEVKVGALPDMIVMTKDGNKLLVANEGEPDDDYLVDPKGSVSIIDISGGVANVTQANVKHLNFDAAPATIAGSLKKPSTTFAEDLEPEYIAVNEASTMAVVACQESNVFVFIDLTTETITSYKGLGFKDHSIAGNGFDASNRDDKINIQTWNVKGVYQPDAITSYTVEGKTYWVSANEGDGRDYSGYSSETRIKDLILDPTAFPNAADLQEDSMLGRLKTFTMDVIGDPDMDEDVDELYSYGARSFSIWDENGDLVWDSGDEIEQYIAANHPDFFNCNDGLASEQDDRSDDKGPEPEAVVVGKIGERFYAFVGLERQGGIMVYNVTDPAAPVFETFVHTYDQGTGTMTDIAPEGLIFVPEDESHNIKNMLIVSNEVSGTTTIYQVIDMIIGVEEQEEAIGFTVAPNPAKEMVRVELKGETNASYVLVNALGVPVKSGILKARTTELELVGLANGMYYLTVYNQDAASSRFTQKIIKH